MKWVYINAEKQGVDDHTEAMEIAGAGVIVKMTYHPCFDGKMKSEQHSVFVPGARIVDDEIVGGEA